MARRKSTARRYTNEQRREVLRRVKAGETQTAIAAATGIPAATIGYWSRKAKEDPPSARGRSAAGNSRSGRIGWALDGDTLVIRIPLRNFARRIAEEALSKI